MTLDDLKERSRLAAADLKRGITDSVAHLKQPAKDRVSAAGGPNGVQAGTGALGWVRWWLSSPGRAI